MALTRPILYSLSAFDATEEHIFYFNVIGGDQVVKNKLVITKQSNNQVVYEDIQTTFAFRHIVPANTLENGEYYSVVVITYNILNEESLPSNGIQFYCFSNPSFDFINIPTGNVINNATYNFIVEYDQNENEGLNSYTFNLYDAQRSLLTSSGLLYVGGQSITPLSVNYTFSGLGDNNTYYVQAVGNTIHGIQVDTGLILIGVKYVSPNVFSIIDLHNNCEGGYITVQSNLIAINGQSNPSPPNYVDDGTVVDIKGEGEYVLWNTGYNITGDFTASLWGRDFNDNSRIITLTNGNQTLTINYRKNEDGLNYVELIVQEGYIIYYIYSTPIYVYPNDKIQIWFRRVGYLYEIYLYDLTERPIFILDSITMGIIGLNILG